MTTKISQKKSGFTLVELLIYIGGLLAIGSVLTLMVVQFYGLYNEIISTPKVDRAGILLVDQITKDIRSSNSIDLMESQFASSSSVLVLNTFSNETQIIKKFYLENGVVKYQENDNDSTNISPKNLKVIDFNFNYLPTPISQSIRFTITFEYKSGKSLETKSYTGFAILRESYE